MEFIHIGEPSNFALGKKETAKYVTHLLSFRRSDHDEPFSPVGILEHILLSLILRPETTDCIQNLKISFQDTTFQLRNLMFP